MAWLANFQRLQRKYTRHSLAIFSTSRTALRVQALLFIRHMATLIPDPAMDQALKVAFPTFVLQTPEIHALACLPVYQPGSQFLNRGRTNIMCDTPLQDKVHGFSFTAFVSKAKMRH